MERYMGKVVQLIYIDRKRQVSIRDVRIMSVKGELIKAYCLTAKAYRIFNICNIVDISIVKSKNIS